MSVTVVYSVVRRVLGCHDCDATFRGYDNESSADLRERAASAQGWSCAPYRDLCPTCAVAFRERAEAAARERAAATQRRREVKALEERIYKQHTAAGRQLSDIARSLEMDDKQVRQMYEAAKARHDAARAKKCENDRQARERQKWHARMEAERAKEAALPTWEEERKALLASWGLSESEMRRFL